MITLKRTLLVITLLLLALSIGMQIRFSLTGDKDWLMFAAEEWVSGKKLYVDIFELNPPLILWLYAIPAWISLHSVFFADYVMLGIMGVCAAALAIRTCVRIAAFHPAFSQNMRQQAALVVVLAGLFLFLTTPVYFFDRDNIMLMLTFPYMLRFMPALEGRALPWRVRFITGLLAAAGFLIKPHALLVFCLWQLLRIIRQRSLKVVFNLENGIVLVLGTAYLAFTAWYAPEYFTVVFPIAWHTYNVYNANDNVRIYLSLAAILAVIPLMDFRPGHVTPYRREVRYFIEITVSYLAYALISNGWGYSYNPLFNMLFFLTCWLLWEYGWLKRTHEAKGENVRLFSFGMRACMIGIGVNLFYSLSVLYSAFALHNCGGFTDCEGDAPYVRYIQDHNITSFGVISSEFTAWPQIAWLTGASWDTRFNHLWMMPAIAKAREEHDASLQWVLDYVGRAYSEDLIANQPDTVFVDNSDEFFTYHKYIDILGLLKTVPDFSRTWSYYHFDSSINVCRSKNPREFVSLSGCHYDIYRRTDATQIPAAP